MNGVYTLIEQFERTQGAFTFKSGLAFFQKRLTFDAEGILDELAREVEQAQEKIQLLSAAKEIKIQNMPESFDNNN